MTLDCRPLPRCLLGIQIEAEREPLERRMSMNHVRDDVASLRDVMREPSDGAVIGMEIECRGDREKRWRNVVDDCCNRVADAQIAAPRHRRQQTIGIAEEG